MIENRGFTFLKTGLWISILLISVFVLLISVFESSAAEFIAKDQMGTWHYSCGNYCGRVRVFIIDKNHYRVLSVHFSGDVSAKSPEKAARIACREDDSTGKTMAQAAPNRACP
ncbi:hypothetical protein KKA14_04920 [bacterium]|nr:hypothetical protein [bacterium]